MNLWVIFLTGLTTGGLACLAVQGGLLTSVIANQKDQELELLDDDKEQLKAKKRAAYVSKVNSNSSLTKLEKMDWMPVGIFLVVKLISHTLLGFLLGFLGEKLSLSLGVRLTFQAFTAFFMFATAMNLLDVHPIFRFVLIQPPKFIQKMVRGSSKSKALFAPAFLGFLTIFIPCGVTQAMAVLAINTASPIQGALIMFAFVLGTSPLFALIGVATAKLSETWNKYFTKIASYLLIAMAVYSINGVLLVLNSPITLQNMVQPVTYFFSDERFTGEGSNRQVGKDQAVIENGVQKVTIVAQNSGYTPNYFSVKKGVPVELTVQSMDVYSCAADFVFKEFGISVFLGPTDSKSFTFTPTKKGKFTYSCSMGMYSGVMEVL
ncbi:sulfite exporter TauE/SafE family protein [Candidatus Woesebacteria bacterium]|nr:sulfite exporter TauE/SafE family protein [Candidatus Woesebacteria bacterium]